MEGSEDIIKTAGRVAGKRRHVDDLADAAMGVKHIRVFGVHSPCPPFCLGYEKRLTPIF
jgi:hypothetical protein